MFRAYQANLPFPHPQHLIINYSFSLLSITWQASSIVCAFFILTEVIFHLDLPMVTCILFYCRQVQLYSTGTFINFISIARFFAHFWSDQYFNLPHRKIGKICLWTNVIISCLSTFVSALLCVEDSFCSTDTTHLCVDNLFKMSIKACIIPVTIFNVAIILSRLHKMPCFQFLQKCNITLPGFVNNSIAPACVPIELPTISNNLESPSVPHVTIPNSSPHNVTFTTKLITIILATMGAGMMIEFTNFLGLPFNTSALVNCYSLIIPTFFSVYWFLANQEMREFASRVFSRVFNKTR